MRQEGVYLEAYVNIPSASRGGRNCEEIDWIEAKIGVIIVIIILIFIALGEEIRMEAIFDPPSVRFAMLWKEAGRNCS